MTTNEQLEKLAGRKLPRRIIQIAAFGHTATIGENAADQVLIALCSDGTVWAKDWPAYVGPTECHWVKLADIPQD
jgi:hypothetical protein